MESTEPFQDLLKQETRALYPQTFWSSVLFRRALDMHTKVFVFPKESDNSVVTLTAQLTKPLKALTGKTVVYSVSVSGADVFFKPPESSAPMHFCVTWESTSGITELWVDGKPMVRRSMKREYSLGTEASIVLGQEQDAFAGGFDKNQPLVGDIGDVNMWDYVLSPEEISTVYAGGTFSPNVLDWWALKYKTH
ncbi:hypothetical protein EI555_001932, partial [Monodon monoceros]